MKITAQFISIPPFISTSWNNIASIRSEESHIDFTVFITLTNGQLIEIPDLDRQTVEQIFTFHERFQENTPTNLKNLSKLKPFPSFTVKMGLQNMDTLSSVLQHKQEDSHLPDLPDDVLSKLTELSSILGPEEISAIPKPEPHCNCPHCQITRAILKGAPKTQKEPFLDLEEPVLDSELRFKEWDIQELSKDLYKVSNPLDPEESYNVFLAEPIGCTCGSKICDHIKAVLSS